ncbi:MAG: HAMP domain-containing histidine kinase [Pseudomonadota bacterium]|nr:HAMP domain-containing histidine kinase [Pseudomonadota bacterium]
MSVRLKLALTVFATGLVTALLVIATIVYSLQRFENETAYRRGMGFLMRVVSMYDNLFDMHDRDAAEFQRWLRGLVLFEPNSELYLLGLDGRVLAKTGPATLAPELRVALGPVRESIERADIDYVMGDDPERMDAGAVVVASVVNRTLAGDRREPAGYLYLVLHTQQLPEGRWDVLKSSFTRPALGLTAAVVALTTLLAALIIATVTEPLRRLTLAVSTLSQRGLAEGLTIAPGSPLPRPTRDEFGQLTSAFEMLLEVCRRQWNALRRTDHYRREGISNLSHDLRTPLTATVACLETLEGRWSNAPERSDDRRLAEIALRNTRNAARMVQSLGDLAKLDEPEFSLRREAVDIAELLDDIALRFAERAARQGVALQSEAATTAPAVGAAARTAPRAKLDVELFERAIANLVDNALKFCGPGCTVRLEARGVSEGRVAVSVADDGPGIPHSDQPLLFDRFYQSRPGVPSATGEGGRGLGLAIVKRIAELHGGDVAVESAPGRGTRITLTLPASANA